MELNLWCGEKRCIASLPWTRPEADWRRTSNAPASVQSWSTRDNWTSNGPSSWWSFCPQVLRQPASLPDTGVVFISFRWLSWPMDTGQFHLLLHRNHPFSVTSHRVNPGLRRSPRKVTSNLMKEDSVLGRRFINSWCLHVKCVYCTYSFRIVSTRNRMHIRLIWTRHAGTKPHTHAIHRFKIQLSSESWLTPSKSDRVESCCESGWELSGAHSVGGAKVSVLFSSQNLAWWKVKFGQRHHHYTVTYCHYIS